MDDSQADDQSLSASAIPKQRNAFAELMSPRSRPPPQQPKPVRNSNPHDPGNGLLAYIQEPEKYPFAVIRATDHSVLIRDAYPKSLVHLLLLPRDPTKYNLHPHDAFADSAFLALVRSETEAAVRLAASELSRLLSPVSRTSQARITAMNAPDPPAELPPGRDFAGELKVGIHAHPSMNQLHIHIISPDMSSDTMRHRKHYNSFNTGFFIPLADFPLHDYDPRKQVKYQNDNLKQDFRCWRCGRMFGNKFKELKEHLKGELDEWKRE
ncbi:hypothetical protein DV735_g3177, partial [Chaetothyriales sp. CBS 134920]